MESAGGVGVKGRLLRADQALHEDGKARVRAAHYRHGCLMYLEIR